jgi:uncharacterized OB-fold protein
VTDARPEKPRPAPAPDADSAAFWAASLEGRLVLQRCTACGSVQHPPRAFCVECHGAVETIEASGRGTVYSRTVIRQNLARPFRDLVPYVVALVDLDEGPRLMTNVVGCDPDDVAIGARVRVRFERVSDDAAIPLFELDGPEPDPEVPRS